MSSSTTRSRRRCGQPVPCPQQLSTRVVHAEVSTVVGCRVRTPATGSGGRADHGPGPDRLDRRGTRPGGPTLVASPRRVALHAHQRERPRPVATSTLMSGEAAAPASGYGPHWTCSGSLSPVLSPRMCLPCALQPTKPAVGARQPAQDRPIGMAHRICKAGVKPHYTEMSSPGRQDSGMTGSATPRRPPRGLPHADPKAELHEARCRLRRGLPPGRRAVGLHQVDGMPREPSCGLTEQTRSEPPATARYTARRTSTKTQLIGYTTALPVSTRQPVSTFGTKRPLPGHVLEESSRRRTGALRSRPAGTPPPARVWLASATNQPFYGNRGQQVRMPTPVRGTSLVPRHQTGGRGSCVWPRQAR